MSQFFTDAEKYDFPLPSYNLIRTVFSEGNTRLHAGKVPTKFDAENSIQIVKGFIEKLSQMHISQEKIEDFKSKSESVK